MNTQREETTEKIVEFIESQIGELQETHKVDLFPFFLNFSCLIYSFF